MIFLIHYFMQSVSKDMRLLARLLRAIWQAVGRPNDLRRVPRLCEYLSNTAAPILGLDALRRPDILIDYCTGLN